MRCGDHGHRVDGIAGDGALSWDLAGGLDEPDRNHPGLPEPGGTGGAGGWRTAAPEARLLGGLILLASLATAAIALTKSFVLAFLQSKVTGLHLAAVWSTLLLFAAALGAFRHGGAPLPVRPQACRYAKPAGRTAGNLYAISTIGQYFRHISGRFVLIAWLGSTNILLLMAAVLSLASGWRRVAAAAPKRRQAPCFSSCMRRRGAYDAELRSAGFVDTDTAYNRVIVFKGVENATGRLMRVMVTGPHAKQSAMYLDAPAALALPYTRYFRLVEHFVPEMRRLLVLGGGRVFRSRNTPWRNYSKRQRGCGGVWIPGIITLARDYFELRDHPRQRIIAEDARTFLNRNPRDIRRHPLRYLQLALCHSFSIWPRWKRRSA